VILLFLVGLTGAGKSTVLPLLLADGRLELPDRRDLTDRVIIPAALKMDGSAASPGPDDSGRAGAPEGLGWHAGPEPSARHARAEGSGQRAPGGGSKPGRVADRLERFRLTARYRESHPDGIVHALAEHLAAAGPAGEAVFDGLRGLAEVGAAERRFPGSRFLMLEALPETRVRRLAARGDEFDRLAGGSEEADLLRARRIVDEEQRHYEQAGARVFLEALPAERRLIIDTDEIAADEVASLVREWL
jgi:hypothetical protein